jgi:hypothetical protein
LTSGFANCGKLSASSDTTAGHTGGNDVNRVRTRLGAALATVALGASMVAVTGGPADALSNPVNPQLTFDRIISSHPFAGAPGNAIDVEGLGYVPADNSMWVADDNGDRVWEIDATFGTWKTTLRGGNPAANPANVDFTTATNVSTGQTCAQATDPNIKDGPNPTGNSIDTGNYSCLSRTDDFESAVFDPGPTAAAGDDVLYVTSGNCCNSGLPPIAPATQIWVNNVPQDHYPYHPTVWKLTRDGTGHFKPSQWQALPEGEDPTAGGLRPGTGLYFGHNNKVWTYDFASNSLGSESTIAVSADIVGLNFPDANTAFVTTATPNTASGRTTATSDSTIQRFDLSGSTWTANTTWKFPLKNIGLPGGGVDDDGMIDARDLAIVSSGGVDRLYVTDGYDGRASADHPIYVYKLGDTPPPTGPRWRYEALNGTGSGVTNDHFDGGNALLNYGGRLHGFYRNSTRSSLAHSWWDGVKWNYENLDGNGRNTNDNVGGHVTSIQYGSQLQLFYSDATTHDLRHAWWDGAAWHFESLDGAGGGNGRTSNNVAGGVISVRQFGSQLQLFYSDDTAHALRHGWWDGSAWRFENLDTGLPSATYVASTQYGSTLQVVYAGSGGLLRHAWYDTAWHKETLDGAGGGSGRTSNNVGDFASILQFGSQLDVVYQDTTDSSLRHAWWNGAKWSFETLDGSGGNIAGHTNNNVGAHIAVLPYAGGLHIWNQDTSTGALRHAWFAGGWHVEIQDGAGSVKYVASTSSDTGRFTSARLWGSQLQLTYFDKANSDRFVHSWYA